jgi:hypothetical protein
MSTLIRKKVWIRIFLPVLLVSFWVLFWLGADFLLAIKWAAILAAISVGLFQLRQRKVDQIATGLSEDEYLLKEAGGALQLLAQSGNVKAIGWFFIFMPIISVIAFALITKSLVGTLEFALLFGLICIPFGIYCLKNAEKTRRIAEKRLG